MSRVFLALERSLGRKVVVKVLLPELAAGVNVERFRREIQLAAQLQHPHIVPLLSAGEADGLPYLVMPFVAGESLRARVAREGEFPIADTVRILRDVVSALSYAHTHGVVHRDVKPDNVLLSGGVAVVTDFGVAKAVTASSSSGEHSSLTSLGVALGTPAYMAPEQATASPNTDHRADIYALGVVAYEMLTGHTPFSGRPVQQVLAAQVIEEPEPVERRRPAVPPMLASLVRECLAKSPADRPQTAAQLTHLLDAIATTPGGGTAATTAIRMPAAKPATRGRQWQLVASVLGFAALLTSGVLWWRHTPTPGVPASGALVTDRSGPGAQPSDSLLRIHPTPPVQPTPPEPPAARRSVAAAGAVPSKKAQREKKPAISTPAGEPAPVTVPVPPVAVVESTPQPPPPPPSRAAVPAPAPVPKPADPTPAIRGVIGDYAGAIESRSLADLRRAYPGMTAMQQRGWEQFFHLVRDVKAQLSVGRLDISNGTADAQVTGTYNYQNTSTGRHESQPVSFHASFENEAGRWRISRVR
ncbi:MAG: eukaryotic-like serine/threonine-protein kinase [Gemmatimonadales bacterium]|nr:eukaryotic-like serine/threonine-protein kinase [Gemmatimonadales bacterium]